METMRYQENKKTSKWPVIAFFLFVLIGGGIVFMAISTEEDPQVIGKQTEEIQGLVDVYDSTQTTAKVEEKKKDLKDITFKIEDEIIKDTTISHFKSSITLPKISVDGDDLTVINSDIKEKYTKLYSSLKDEMKAMENNFTFKISYKYYDNTIGDKRVLSVTVHQRIVDDKEGTTTTDKIETYNIDLATKDLIEESKVAMLLFGKDYKTIIKNQVKDYVVENKMMKQNEFIYALTGLENYYIKEGTFHIIFNEAELVEKKYKVLDIEITTPEKDEDSKSTSSTSSSSNKVEAEQKESDNSKNESSNKTTK